MQIVSERGREAGATCELEVDHEVVVVVLGPDRADPKDHEREERVHGTDVVQHVVVVQRHAAEKHQEVEPPHHLRAQEEPGVLFRTTWSLVCLLGPVETHTTSLISIAAPTVPA